MTMALRDRLQEHLGASLAADSALNGVNYDWMQEFTAQTSGIGKTFTPAIVGFGAPLSNTSDFIDRVSQPVAIAGAAAAYLLLWLFVSGGIIDRYRRDSASGPQGFFGSCGVFFFRFLRLAIIMAIVYGALFRFVHGWLFENLYARLTHDTTVERNAFALRLALYIVFGAALAACNLVFDYAKVRAVVENRRSMLGAIGSAVGFARRNLGATALLYILDALSFAIVLAAYAIMAPGAGGGGIVVWLIFMVGQLYVLARLWVKLLFWASEVSLFQSAGPNGSA